MDTFYMIMFCICFVLAFIPATIARNKGKDYTTWYIYGFLLFFFAMLHAILLPEPDGNNIKNNIENMKKLNNSKKNKKIDVHCPIRIESYDIVKNKSNEKCYCVITFINLAEKQVKAIKFTLTFYNSFGENIIIDNNFNEDYIIQDLHVLNKQKFGMDTYLDLEEFSDARTVEIEVTEILFDDENKWIKGDYELHTIMDTNVYSVGDYNDLKMIVGNDATCYAEEESYGWICNCGELNLLESDNCIRCNRNKNNVLENYSSKELIDEKIKILQEEQRKEEQEEHERKNRKKRKIKIGVLAIFIFIACLVIWNGYKSFKYDTGYNLTESEKISNINNELASNDYDKAKSLVGHYFTDDTERNTYLKNVDYCKNNKLKSLDEIEKFEAMVVEFNNIVNSSNEMNKNHELTDSKLIYIVNQYMKFLDKYQHKYADLYDLAIGNLINSKDEYANRHSDNFGACSLVDSSILTRTLKIGMTKKEVVALTKYVRPKKISTNEKYIFYDKYLYFNKDGILTSIEDI